MPNWTSRVRAVAGALAAALALALTACSPSTASSPEPTPAASETSSATPEPTPSETATPTPAPVINTIDGVGVDGAFGEVPAVSFEPNFSIDETRQRTVIEGDAANPAITEASIVENNYAGYNARTGEKFDSSWDKGKNALMTLDRLVPGFSRSLLGHRAGDRVLMVIPGSEAYDSQNGSPDVGIEVGDTLIFVVDVIAVSVDKATGTEQSPALPVTMGADAEGFPTVAIPAGASQPTERTVATLVQGTQRGIAASDYIMVFYRSYSWRTGALIEDKYATPDAGALADLIPEWKEGLVGVPIGSRVVIVAPDAYPNGQAEPAIEAGDSVVFVIDVLFGSSVV